MAIEPIEIGDLTSGSVNGTGAFDAMMNAVQIRLDREYDKNRIKGTEYSEVYLGSMQSAMGQATAFLLGKDKAANEAALIEAQVILAEAQTNKVLAEIALIELGLPKMQAEIRAIDAGIIKTGAETDNIKENTNLTVKQQEKIDEDILLIQQQILNAQQEILKTQAEISMLGKQEDKVNQEILVAQQQVLNAKEEVFKTRAEISMLGKQEDKVDQDIILSQQQVLNAREEVFKTKAETSLIGQKQSESVAQTGLINQNKSNAIIEGTILTEQKKKVTAETTLIGSQEELVITQDAVEQAKILEVITWKGQSFYVGGSIATQKKKVSAEEDLLKQKYATEQAQTQESVKNGSGSTVQVFGVIKKQKDLYEAQTDGFSRDAEQKLSKIMADAFAVQRSTDEDFVVPASLNAASTNAVIEKAKIGIGA